MGLSKAIIGVFKPVSPPTWYWSILSVPGLSVLCLFLQRSLDDTIDEICDRYLSQMEVDSPDIKKVTENIQDVLDSNIDSPFWTLEKMQNNLKKSEVENPFLNLEKMEAVKRELKFDLAEPEPPKKPKIQQKEPKAFENLAKVA